MPNVVSTADSIAITTLIIFSANSLLLFCDIEKKKLTTVQRYIKDTYSVKDINYY